MQTKFSISEKFQFLEDYVDMISTRSIKSMIVVGDGGLGKSYTVINQLTKNGISDSMNKVKHQEQHIEHQSIVESIFKHYIIKKYPVLKHVLNTPVEIKPKQTHISKNMYVLVKGFSTSKGLYRTLFENKSSIVVFDDCDSSLTDKKAVSILKAALDSGEKRIVTWDSEAVSDLPKSFEFTGSVIFISNLKLNEIPQSLVTRASTADVTMTRLEIIERMYQIINEGIFMKDTEKSIKNKALEFIYKNINNPQITTINLRTLIAVVTNIKCKPENWERLSLNMMISAK